MRRPGFTLIEALISLSLSLFIAAAGVEIFARAERAFLRLKTREEAGQAALAALDRIRIDLLHSGRGLSDEVVLGLFEPVEVIGGELRTTTLETTLRLAADAQAGDTRLSFVSTSDVTAGQRITLRQGLAGEIRTVARVMTGAVLVDAPLGQHYVRDATVVSLLELVTYFRDSASRILRRRVNTSPAQPMLEDTAAVEWGLDSQAHLVRIRLEPAIQGVHPHDATVFLKNPALAGRSEP